MTMTSAATLVRTWHAVCVLERLVPGRGVGALVDRQLVAVFRTAEGELFAIGSVDPYTGANVLARGIVGDRAGEPTVASPMHKQAFSLRTGCALDDPATRVPVHEVRCRDGIVEVAP